MKDVRVRLIEINQTKRIWATGVFKLHPTPPDEKK